MSLCECGNARLDGTDQCRRCLWQDGPTSFSYAECVLWRALRELGGRATPASIVAATGYSVRHVRAVLDDLSWLGWCSWESEGATTRGWWVAARPRPATTWAGGQLAFGCAGFSRTCPCHRRRNHDVVRALSGRAIAWMCKGCGAVEIEGEVARPLTKPRPVPVQETLWPPLWLTMRPSPRRAVA